MDNLTPYAIVADGVEMGTAKSWEVTDDFWARVEPLIPVRKRSAEHSYRRAAGGGRKPKEARLVFEAIFYVLRTGCQWKALPAERFGSASAIHARFLEWEKAGLFENLWKAGLAEYDCMAMAEHRWRHDESALSAGNSRAQSHGSGKKMQASAIC
jgi:transposase